jgi:hypothetical protein
MNANLQKYLKYKSKYLDLKNELEGGNRGRDLWKKVKTEMLRDPKKRAELVAKNNKDTFNNKFFPLKLDQYKHLINQKINLIMIEKQELILYIYKTYKHSEEISENFIKNKRKKFNKMLEEIIGEIEETIINYNKIIVNMSKKLDNGENQIDKQQNHQLVGGIQREEISFEMFKTKFNFEIDDIDNLSEIINYIIDEIIENNQKLNAKQRETKLNEEKFKLSQLKEEKIKIEASLQKIQSYLDNLQKTTTKVATNDSGDNPSKRNRKGSEYPPSDDDNGDDFDCEELKRNIDKLCAFYKYIKDTNDKMKDKIKDVFKSVNNLTKSTNQLQNKGEFLSIEEVTSISEENKKTLNNDKLADTITNMFNEIDNEKNPTKKKELIIRYSAASEVIKSFFNPDK